MFQVWVNPDNNLHASNSFIQVFFLSCSHSYGVKKTRKYSVFTMSDFPFVFKVDKSGVSFNPHVVQKM